MVRVGKLEDLAWIVEVAREVGEAPQWREEDYRRVLEGGTAAVRRQVFCWERAGFAVGMVMRSGDWCEGEIENVVVLTRERRRGIGRALCGAAVAWCLAERASVVRLEVRDSSVGAIRLYEGFGFGAVGIRKAYYREPLEDAVQMEFRPLVPRL